MHYMYDPWVDVPFLLPELGQNAQNLTFKWPLLAYYWKAKAQVRT